MDGDSDAPLLRHKRRERGRSHEGDCCLAWLISWVGELSFKKTLPPGNSPLFPIFLLPIHLASHLAFYLPNPCFHHKYCIQQHIAIAFSLSHSHLASSKSCISNLRSIACITVTMRPSVVGAAISLLSYSAGVAAQTFSDCNPLQDSEFSCHFQVSGISLTWPFRVSSSTSSRTVCRN